MADHGTRAAYLARCRCQDCKQANAAYVNAYRKRARAQAVAASATETRRRALNYWDCSPSSSSPISEPGRRPPRNIAAPAGTR